MPSPEGNSLTALVVVSVARVISPPGPTIKLFTIIIFKSQPILFSCFNICTHSTNIFISHI